MTLYAQVSKQLLSLSLMFQEFHPSNVMRKIHRNDVTVAVSLRQRHWREAFAPTTTGADPL